MAFIHSPQGSTRSSQTYLNVHRLNGIGLVGTRRGHKHVLADLALVGVNERLAVLHVLSIVVINNVKGSRGVSGGVNGVAPLDGNSLLLEVIVLIEGCLLGHLCLSQDSIARIRTSNGVAAVAAPVPLPAVGAHLITIIHDGNRVAL
jgi:hypothetical protein